MQPSLPSSPYRSFLSVAFFAGPVLLALSMIAFTLQVGMLPSMKASWVEGILGSFALIFFVPIYLELARQLSATHRRTGLAAMFTGLFGGVVGFGMEFLRVLEHALRQRGAGDAVWSAFAVDPGAELLVVALFGPLFPITSIMLGIGFLRAKTLPSWIAASLIVAGIGFPLAQVAEWEWGFRVTYPLACLLWAVAIPSAWRSISEGSAWQGEGRTASSLGLSL